MPDPDLLALSGPVLLGLVLGLTLIWLLWHLDQARAPRGTSHQVPDDSIAMLFDHDLLLDASPQARTLLGPTASASGWDQAARALSPLFPAFPTSMADLPSRGQLRLAPVTPGHVQPLCLTVLDGRIRLDLAPETGGDRATTDLRHHSAELATLRRAADEAPLAIWQTEPGQRVSWANAAYRALAQDMRPDFPASRGIAPLFVPADLDQSESSPRRVSLPRPNGGLRWFSVTTARSGDSALHYAQAIDSVVLAETAQRNFVQTLTKTFATLSIGLAIFDRDRRLAMFNPALIDLTALPADFLSSRPTLAAVFDRMRDSQTMPEPRDYASWRQRMADLVAAASDGKFLETWVLPGGQTYRVTGRPHPDGAIAFVFEDISAEMTLTRRFRSELGLGKAVLNQLPQAIAVFSAAGVLTLSNSAYAHMWKADPDHAFAETTVQDALRHWRDMSTPDSDWQAVQAALFRRSALMVATAMIKLHDGTTLTCQMMPLQGGSVMAVFNGPATAASPLSALLPAD